MSKNHNFKRFLAILLSAGMIAQQGGIVTIAEEVNTVASSEEKTEDSKEEKG